MNVACMLPRLDLLIVFDYLTQISWLNSRYSIKVRFPTNFLFSSMLKMSSSVPLAASNWILTIQTAYSGSNPSSRYISFNLSIESLLWVIFLPSISDRSSATYTFTIRTHTFTLDLELDLLTWSFENNSGPTT